MDCEINVQHHFDYLLCMEPILTPAEHPEFGKYGKPTTNTILTLKRRKTFNSYEEAFQNFQKKFPEWEQRSVKSYVQGILKPTTSSNLTNDSTNSSNLTKDKDPKISSNLTNDSTNSSNVTKDKESKILTSSRGDEEMKVELKCDREFESEIYNSATTSTLWNGFKIISNLPFLFFLFLVCFYFILFIF